MAKNKTLQQVYNEDVIPKLKKELGITNNMAVPRVTKVKLNIGMGTYIKTHGKDTSSVIENLAIISGQKPVTTKSKKAVSNFKIREDEVIGTTVTLRGKRMYEFLNKLVNIVFPRVRDFRGISPKAFDGNGNYSVGFKEHIVFPEISPDDVLHLHGLQASISTSAKTDEEGLALLTALGFPFKKQPKKD
jgi:large subunit ribosomal protein L5